MDSEIVRASIDKHLEAIEKILLWALAIAGVVGWAGMSGQEPIKFLGLEATRNDAYWIAGSAFVLANLALLVAFLRIADLLNLLSNGEFIKGIDKLVTHPFLFNPFAYFGNRAAARIHSCFGFGMLIICWWSCYAAVSTLRPRSVVPPSIEIVFLGVGLASMVAVNRCYSIVISGLKKYQAKYAKELESTRVERTVATFASIGIGGLIYTFANLPH